MIDDNLRADARENKERILKVAQKALVADPGASLNSIAKAAGVGPGTLYRHFPNRESLVLEVYRQEIDELAALAPVLLTQHPPLQAFRLWCDRLAQFGRMKHGVADIINTGKSDKDFQGTYKPILGAVRQLMDVCEASGEILPGSNSEDFLMLMGFMWRLPLNSAGEERTKRLMALIFRGLGASDSI